VTTGDPSPRLDLRHLTLLHAVCEEGSLTAAAARLHLTPSALSHRLRDAERAVGRPLFLREGRRMRPTPAGERLRSAAGVVLDELERAEREVRGAERPLEGVVRVATECHTCYHWLPATIEAFRRRYPAVDVEVAVEATREPVPALLDGRIDVGIVSGRVRSSRLRVEPLFDDELVAVLPSGHALRRAAFLSPQDFAGEHLITYSAPKTELTVFRDVLLPAGVTPRRWTRMQLTEATVELVRAGQGIAVMARWAAAPYLARGGLVLRRLTRAGLPRRWSAAFLRRRREVPYIGEFVRILSRRAGPAAASLARSGAHG
jgi:LysR family transcriptional regulator for metE and metH